MAQTDLISRLTTVHVKASGPHRFIPTSKTVHTIDFSARLFEELAYDIECGTPKVFTVDLIECLFDTGWMFE